MSNMSRRASRPPLNATPGERWAGGRHHGLVATRRSNRRTRSPRMAGCAPGTSATPTRAASFTLGARPRRRDGWGAVRGSGRVGLPAGALAGIDPPQVAAVATLQVDQRGLVAQEVLPMRAAIRRGALALVAAGVVAALGARKPGTSSRIGGGVNRQHDSPSDPAAHLP